MDAYEHVYSVTDYYDGPRGGVADFGGQPHAYLSLWDDSEEQWDSTFVLRRIDEETLELVKEEWARWLRWRKAFDEERTSISTHPALPEERERHEEIAPILRERLAVDKSSTLRAVGHFRVVDGQWQVRWEPDIS